MLKQQMKQLIKTIDQEDWDRMTTLFTDDACYEVPGRAAMHGLQALLHYYRVERDVLNGHHAVDNVIAENYDAVLWGRFTGESKTGKPINVRFVDRCHFRNEKIGLRTVYFFAPPS